MKSLANPQPPGTTKSASKAMTTVSQKSTKTAGSSLLAALEASPPPKGTTKGKDGKVSKHTGNKGGNSVKGKTQGKNK